MFGLDISDRMLRLVSLEKKRKSVSIESVSEVPVPPGIINEGEIVKPDSLQSIISNLVQAAKPRRPHSKKVVSCLPERKSFIKVLHMKENSEPSDEIIKSELANHIPDDLSKMYIDWQIVNKGTESESILVGAVPKSIVESYQDVIGKAKLVPYVLEIESAAIVRAIMPEEPLNSKESVLVIDIGLDRTSFVIVDHSTIQFTSALTEISGNLMTSLIMKNLSLSYEEAEKAKRIGGLSKNVGKGAVASILSNQLESLVEKVKQIIEFYQAHHTGQNPVSSILLTGGGANLLELQNELVLRLGLKIQKGDSLLNISNKDTNLITVETQSSYATAIGLALRALNHGNT
ncbi:type IV pilus assembly protein PilM [Patescibacteria group bacterium]|nr:type IV pilus assembly protein PilM [Patescibacteria group bacterium]